MKSRVMIVFVALSLATFSSAAENKKDFENWYQDWTLGQAINSAQLVLVAKVTHVGKVKVVEGAKTNQYFREFRFQPIQRIKGIYSRDELVMSAADLGCRSSTGPDAADIREGQLRILMLSQSNPLMSTLGCAAVTSSKNFRQAVPLLTGRDDPIIAMFETMCRLANVRSRKRRVEMIVTSLNTSQGPAVIPLLESLRKDAVWAAAHRGIVDPLIRFSRDERQPIRTEAMRTIGAVLSWANNASVSTERMGQVIHAFLKEKDQKTDVRVLAVRALEHLNGTTDWRIDTLLDIVRNARTHRERIAAIDVLGQLEDAACFNALAAEYETLPLDCNHNLEMSLGQALLKIDRSAGTKLLMNRFRESDAVGQSTLGEFELIAEFRIRESTGELKTAMQNAAPKSQISFIRVLGKLKAEEAVPDLGELLRSSPNVAAAAVIALVEIGTRDAAIELRPMLKTERNLRNKLRIAAVLAQHGFDDGFSMAIEHLADETEISLLAANVLSAIESKKSEKQLIPILNNNPDQQWYAAALAGLLAVENEQALEALAKILADDRHPIIIKAARFARFADQQFVLPHLTKLIESRNRDLSLAALQGHSDLIKQDSRQTGFVRDNKTVPVSITLKDGVHQDELLATLKRVLADSYIDAKVREKALSVLAYFPIEESAGILIEMLDRTDFSSGRIPAQIERLIRDKKVQIP